MQLHELRPNFQQKDKRTRVGRGGKRGTTSGKGQKGQKARAGHRIRPAERDYIQRLPKLKGIKNKVIFKHPDIMNLPDVVKHAKDGVISAKILGRKVKILGNGEVTTKITVEGLAISKSARAKIEAAGGKVVEVAVASK